MNKKFSKKGFKKQIGKVSMTDKFNNRSFWRDVSAILVVLALVWSALLTVATTFQALRWRLPAAGRAAQKAVIVPRFLSTITLRQIKTFEWWRTSLEVVIAASELELAVDSYLSTVLTNVSTVDQKDVDSQLSSEKLLTTSQTLANHVRDFQRLLGKTILGSWIARQQPAIYYLGDGLADFHQFLNQLLVGEHTYLLLLQNSQELRATGGFMGSYAPLTISQGQLGEIKIKDIYEPDGQFTGFIEAPVGIKKYLSSGQGMRLPDSNWSPDFPSSARNILHYFALGEKQEIEGLVTVNLTVVEDLLKSLGGIYLPDYKITVTADNLATVARSDRSQFFPGSQQKPHFLTALFNQLKYKLTDLSASQKKEIFLQLIANLKSKKLQFYSNEEQVQQIFKKWGVAGVVSRQPSMMLLLDTSSRLTNQSLDQDLIYPLMLVESNVGINKVNDLVDRQVKLDITAKNLTITIDFINNNFPPSLQEKIVINQDLERADHNGYINYQRLLVPLISQVKAITIGSKQIDTWDESVIVTASGEEFRQIGFLVTVSEQQQQTVVIELVHTEVLPDKSWLLLLFQSGLSPTNYTLHHEGEIQKLQLKADALISL